MYTHEVHINAVHRLLGRLHTQPVCTQPFETVGIAAPLAAALHGGEKIKAHVFKGKQLYFVRQLGTCQQKQVKTHELIPGGLMLCPGMQNFSRYLD